MLLFLLFPLLTRFLLSSSPTLPIYLWRNKANSKSSVNQVVGSTKRGTVTAYAGSWGQVGGIVSAVAYPESTGPKYVPGIMTCVGLNIAGIACAAMLWGFCAYENKQRAAGKRDYLRELPQEAQDKLGEKHPDFRYTL